MKREILFRGKANDGEWVYGGITNANHHYAHKTQIVSSEFYEFMEEDAHLIFIDIIPKTIGQYTGLKDKNGKEIFEGDILTFGNNNPVEVIFDNGCFNVFDEPLGWSFDEGENNIPIKTNFKYCEVIGNIYDNPEPL